MIRKILIITVLALLPFFFTTCGDSGIDGGDATVKITFDGVSKLTSIQGIPVTQKAPISKALPSGIDTIRIKVYVGTEAEGTIFDETIDATDNITIEVPSGEARVFKVYGFDSTGSLIYSGASTPVDLVGGEDTNVSISLGTPAADAVFSVKLLAEDGVSDFTDPGYLSAGTKFTADVYRPTINTTPEPDQVVLGAAIDTVPSTTFTTSLSGLNAFASTPQIVIVRAFTLDGTIAAIGIAAFADLSDGTNSTPIPVVMNRPGKIDIIHTSPITSVVTEIWINGAYRIVATNGISTGPNSIMVSVPNHKTNIGTGNDYGGTINVRITVNGGTPTVISTPSAMTIKWKLIDVNFSTASWSTHPDEP